MTMLAEPSLPGRCFPSRDAASPESIWGSFLKSLPPKAPQNRWDEEKLVLQIPLRGRRRKGSPGAQPVGQGGCFLRIPPRQQTGSG